MVLAVTMMQGFEKAATSAGVLALEFVMTYVAARALVRRDEDVLTALNAYCLATSVVAVLALLDPLYGSFVVHNWFGTLTDYVRAAQADYRMGLLRAAGSSSIRSCLVRIARCPFSFRLPFARGIVFWFGYAVSSGLCSRFPPARSGDC